MIENFNSWINFILAIEFVGIVIIVMQYIPAFKNKISLKIGIIILVGAVIVKIGFYANYFLTT